MTIPREKDTERQTDRKRISHQTSLKGKDPAGRCVEVSCGCLSGSVPYQLSPQGLVPYSGGPCGHTAHRNPLVSRLSFAPRAQGPQRPLLGPTPILQEWGDYWLSRGYRAHQVLASLGALQPPNPGPVCWPPQTPGQKTEVRGRRGCKIGTRVGDSQGGPYKAVADQLGLQPPQPPEDALSVGSEGPQDLLQGCPGLRLTPLRQPLTECQQCIYTLSCPTQVCL